MEKTNSAIAYVYKRNIINEDEEYITFTYSFSGILVGKEVESEGYSYSFIPTKEANSEDLSNIIFTPIDDVDHLDTPYVYAFPYYLGDEKDEQLIESLKKIKNEADIISDVVLCQIYTKGASSISTQYIDPDDFETLTDISTCDIDGLLSILSNKHEKVKEVKSMLKSIHNDDGIVVSSDNVIYADDIYNLASKTVICQDDQIKAIAASIAKNLRIKNPELKDNLLICGPTGVGKSEIFRCISNSLGIPITFEDSTEYTASGYVGKSVTDMLYNLYINAGKDVKKAERGIIIIDEIDKKVSGNNQHDIYTKAVLDSLLKMAEGHKYHVENKNCTFDIDTSFITFAMMGAFSGIEEFSEKKRNLGFVSEEERKEAEKTPNIYTVQTLKKYGLKPEFLGRNKLIVMNSLDVPELCQIIENSDKSVLLLYKYLLEEIGIKLIYDPSCVVTIAKKAKELGVGARSIKKIIEKAFEVIEYQVFSKNSYSELIITPETFEDNTKFILR